MIRMNVGKRMLVVLGAVATATIVLGACSRGFSPARKATAAGVAWEHNLDVALSRASGEKKIVMVDFYTDWCGWCRRLDETTYADADVQHALRGLVPVKLDAEKDGRRAARRYRVQGYPTIVFLDAGGAEVGRIPGYLPPKPFLEELQDIVARS
jgi:thiol:disulfide interchange protein